jgi:hypothetical protein
MVGLAVTVMLAYSGGVIRPSAEQLLKSVYRVADRWRGHW